MRDKALHGVLEESLIYIKNQLNLYDWHILSVVDSLKHHAAGQCSRQYEYKSATLSFDAKVIRSKRKAREYLRHELLHCVMAPMDRIETAVRPFLTKKEKKLLRCVVMEVEHDIIHHIEGILDYRVNAPLRPKKKKRKKLAKKRHRKRKKR